MLDLVSVAIADMTSKVAGRRIGLKVVGGLLMAALPASASAGCASLGNAALVSKFAETASLCTESITTAPAIFAPAVVDRPSVVSIAMAAPLVAAKPAKAKRVAARHPRQDPALAALIDSVARQHRIDPRLLASIVRTESGGRADAVSHKGALGLMQVMPGTARGLGVNDPARLLTDHTLALTTGARYLKQLQTTFGNNVPIVVAAYNAGPGAILKAGGRIPNYRETQGYVGAVMSRYAAARAAVQ